MNPLVGQLVPSYEAWNLHYPTLTDKAAKDFETIPALAESWESSEDGRTWTYKLRDGLKWSDGKPLTSEDIAWTINTSREEEWLNHSATTANITATAPDPDHGGPQELGRRSEAPDDGRLHPPQAHLGKDERRGAPQVRRHRRGRRRPVRAREVRKGPVRPLQGQPQLLGRQAGRGPGRAAQVQQSRRHGRGAEDGRARRRVEHPRQRVQTAQEGPEHRDQRGLPGLVLGDRHQRRRRAQEAPSGAARPRGATRRSRTRSTRK